MLNTRIQHGRVFMWNQLPFSNRSLTVIEDFESVPRAYYFDIAFTGYELSFFVESN